jgi:ABC-type lipoprotein release transport system permease subunit
MTLALFGAIAGLAVGYAAFEAINQLARRVEKDETKRVLRIAGMADLIIFPVIGFFAVPMMFGGV